MPLQPDEIPPAKVNDMEHVRCIVCGKKFTVAASIASLMRHIGVITCSPVCAMKWTEQND